MAWTGITAAALYAAAASGWRGRGVAHCGLAFLVTVALHALWDSQQSLPGTVAVGVGVGVGVVSLVVLGITVHRSAAVARSSSLSRTVPAPARSRH